MIHIYDKKGFQPLATLDCDRFVGADLSGRQLDEANLVEHDLSDANLQKAS
ncbi:MAG: pentapeptide repeat-containing protein, partial [Gammaproteobacteria bacterium]|nr:pentapeptide repeat-containing protein [Gammaproteobacteria bacterium]